MAFILQRPTLVTVPTKLSLSRWLPLSVDIVILNFISAPLVADDNILNNLLCIALIIIVKILN